MEPISTEPSIYRFEKCELLVLRGFCLTEDLFLERVADIIGKLTEERDEERQRANFAESWSRSEDCR
jgi:hypothetical protein